MTLALVVLVSLVLTLQVVLVSGLASIGTQIKAAMRVPFELGPPPVLEPPTLPPLKPGDLADCPNCYGSGRNFDGNNTRVCWQCHGTRKVTLIEEKLPEGMLP